MATADATVTVDQLAVWPIDDLDGREARLLVVEVPPGVHAPIHHHDGWQFISVLEGMVTSQMDGESAERYETGQAWYERREQRSGLRQRRRCQSTGARLLSHRTGPASALVRRGLTASRGHDGSEVG